jgi:hypothetical protein
MEVFGIKLNFMSIAQLGLAAMTGGTSLLASTALRTIGSQIAMNVIQRLGQQLGLPQPMIDIAQAAFANASGQPGLARQNIREAVQGFVQSMDLRPSEAGQLQRELMGASDKSYENLMDIVRNFKSGSADEEGNVRGGGRGSKASGSWLVAFAKAMGAALDAKAAQIKAKSDSIADMAGSSVDRSSNAGKQHSEKLSSETQLLQAYTQEMSMIANAATNALKTMGEAQSTIARK